MKQTQKIALCGVIAALSVVVMLTTGLIPSATLALPGLAGCLLIPVVAELGTRWGFATYAVCAVLSGILSPDREAALVYVLLLGYYPVLFGVLARIRQTVLRVLLKFLLVNVAAAAEIALSYLLLQIPLEAEGGWVMVLLFWLLVNVTFFLYDFALRRWIDLYFAKLRPRLRQLFRFH